MAAIVAAGAVVTSLFIMTITPGGTNFPHHHDREEEIYLQGGGEPIRLPRSHPALQLLQRVRAMVDGRVKNLDVCTRCLRSGKVEKAVRCTHKPATA